MYNNLRIGNLIAAESDAFWVNVFRNIVKATLRRAFCSRAKPSSKSNSQELRKIGQEFEYQGPVSRKWRNLWGPFRGSLYLGEAEILDNLKVTKLQNHVRRTAYQNKRTGSFVSREMGLCSLRTTTLKTMKWENSSTPGCPRGQVTEWRHKLFCIALSFFFNDVLGQLQHFAAKDWCINQLTWMCLRLIDNLSWITKRCKAPQRSRYITKLDSVIWKH